MTLRLLIDACLTPASVAELKRRFGAKVDVAHVNQLMQPASSDREVLQYARSQDRVLLTADFGDFGAIARTMRDHAGVGLVGDQNGRDRQIVAMVKLVGALLSHVAGGGVLSGFIFRLRRTGRLATGRAR